MSAPSIAAPLISGTTEHWATIEGHRMRYVRAGSGPPLLLIHGLLGYSFSWRFNFSALGRIRAVFAPDLLGTGFSDRPRELDSSAEASAHRMLQLMAQVGAPSFDLLGTSHGGGVATLMADMAPERVRKLVLVAPVNPWSRHGLWITRILSTPVGRISMKTVAPRATFMNDFFMRRIYGNPDRIAAGTLDGYLAPLLIDGAWDYGLNVASCWQKDLAQLEQAYPRVQSETLLMWGEVDPAVYPSSGRELQRRMRHAQLVTFPGVGHLPYEEVPDHFNRYVEQFLT
jgi:pimeloyl-ACP methyl ester carboxylesterase